MAPAIAQDPTATATAAATSTPDPRRHGDHGHPDARRVRRHADLDADLLADPDAHAHGLLDALQHARRSPRPSPRPWRRSCRTPTPGATATPGAPRQTERGRKRKRRNGHAGHGHDHRPGLPRRQEVEEAGKISRAVDPRRTTSFRTRPRPQLQSATCSTRRHPKTSSSGDTPRATERPDGTPTPANPGYSVATPGAAPIGVPNFFIDKFRIPPFLLPVYQAAGIEYGVRWEVLAAINEIETDYGRNLNVSSAGALGWMQFMPATWKQYGVDANRDGLEDPYNPVDAIFAAARYLRAAGAETDIRRAIFAYNHADWYVDSVLMRARLIGGLPSNFVGSLTGLTQGRFPVHAKATYAGQVEKRDKKRKTKAGAERRARRRGRPGPPRDQDLRPPRRAR